MNELAPSVDPSPNFLKSLRKVLLGGAQDVFDDKNSRMGNRLSARGFRSGKPVLRPVLIVSLALIVLASGFVVVLGPARFHPPAFNAVGRPSPPLPTTPVIGQGVHGYASIGPLFPLCTVVGVLGPVPDNIKSVHVIVITSSGERILSQIDWMPSMTCNFVSARPARIAPGPAAVGTFSVNLAPGNYGVTMSNCDSIGQALGCGGLPATVVVSSGVYARLDLAVDTGIR